MSSSEKPLVLVMLQKLLDNGQYVEIDTERNYRISGFTFFDQDILGTDAAVIYGSTPGGGEDGKDELTSIIPLKREVLEEMKLSRMEFGWLMH